MLFLFVSWFHVETQEISFRKEDTRIAFSHCITLVQERELTDFMLGNLYFGSLFLYLVQAVDFSYNV